MRKNLLFLLMAVFALSFTACSDDDDDKTLAGQVAGKYTGEIWVEFNGETTYPNQTVTVTEVSANRINFLLKNFVFEMGGNEIKVGDVEIKDVLVKEVKEKDEDTGKEYTYIDLSGKGTINVVIAQGTPAVPLQIELEGGYLDGELYADIDIPLGAMGNVYVEFEGKK